jgi:adenine-specific DNA-methyltransferase
MLKDNRNYNAEVTSNTAFLKMLRDKLPEFFMADKIDEDGSIISQGTFDFEKFKKALAENSIQAELTSGYQLNFIGKDYAKKQAGEAPTTVVLPDKVHNEQKENKNSKNLFFTGDNLEVLRHLQAGYESSIDVIYIDPPYNTGSDGFVYPDKFEYSDDKLQAMFGMNDEELERLKSIQGKATHSAWLTFMYPRLWLAKRLLKETGVIFVSIDDNEQANLKLLMDELFGEGQIVAEMIVDATPKNDPLMIATSHEYVLVYVKDKQAAKTKTWGYKHPLNEKLNKLIEGKNYHEAENELAVYYRDNNLTSDNISNYKFVDAQGIFRTGPLDDPQSKGPRDKRINLKTGNYLKIPSRGWSCSIETWNEWVKQDLIYFPDRDDRLPGKKTYLNDGKLEIGRSVIKMQTRKSTNYLKDLFGLKNVFTNPKPIDLLKYLFNLSTDKNITILDFFAGSATTADAVMQLNAEDGGNRQFIMVQLPEPTFTQNSDGTKVARKGSESAFKAGYQSIDEISRERIKRASQKIQEEKGLELPEGFDGGFKHYRVLEPTQATLNDLDSFDIESGDFIDNNGNSLLFKESDFDDMISPFSSKGLGFEDGAAGEETILSTWLLADGYSLLSSGEKLDLAGYEASYVNSERLYLIAEGWSSEQTKELVNIIGKNEKVIPTIVLYGYSFGMESMRELELALDQLDTKVNLVKRY